MQEEHRSARARLDAVDPVAGDLQIALSERIAGFGKAIRCNHEVEPGKAGERIESEPFKPGGGGILRRLKICSRTFFNAELLLHFTQIERPWTLRYRSIDEDALSAKVGQSRMA